MSRSSSPGVQIRLQVGFQRFQRVERGLQVFDDLGGDRLGRSQVVAVRQAVVLEPEQVEAGLVTGQQFAGVMAAPAALRVRFAERGLARRAVVGPVKAHELVEVGVLQRARLEREALVRAQVVQPHALHVRLAVGPRWFAIEEQHVRLHALGAEQAGGQPQNGVQVAWLQQLAVHGFRRAAFEQHVVGQHHRRAAVHLQAADDVLHDVELLVRGGGPEVFAVDGQRLPGGSVEFQVGCRA